jgi:hypothetical protein
LVCEQGRQRGHDVDVRGETGLVAYRFQINILLRQLLLLNLLRQDTNCGEIVLDLPKGDEDDGLAVAGRGPSVAGR